MTFNQIVEQVKINLGNPGDTETELLIQGQVNFVLTQDLYNKGMPYYDARSDFSTVASQDYVSLPSNFFKATNVFLRESGQTSYENPLKVFEWEDIRDFSEGKPTTCRVYYNDTLDALALHFRPVPNAVYEGLLLYKAKETEISGTQEAILSAIYGDMPIIAGATYYSALKARRDETAGRWFTEYDRAVKNLLRWMRDVHGEEYETPGLYM